MERPNETRRKRKEQMEKRDITNIRERLHLKK